VAEAIVATVAGAIIIAALSWLVKSIPLVRPKVSISWKRGPAGSSPGPNDKLTVEWSYHVVLYNATKHEAFDLGFVHTGSHAAVSIPARHLKGREPMKIPLKLTKLIDREIVVRCRHNFDELLPSELRTIEFILKYKNEGGCAFYTHYRKDNDSESCSYHIRRPRPLAT